MPVTAFVNELSMRGNYPTVAAGATAMKQFVHVLRELRHKAGAVALHTPTPLKSLVVAENFSIPIWLGSGDYKDEWRFLLALQNRAPYGFGLESYSDAALGLDYVWGGEQAVGLGWADITDGIAVSVTPGAEPWREPLIEVRCDALTEDDSDHLEIVSTYPRIRHALEVEHVQSHSGWLLDKLNGLAPDGRSLWAERGTLFSHLSFLSRVEGQLSRLPSASPTLRAVRERLHEINDAIRTWNPAQTPMPSWQSKVTPEHEGRRQLCNFNDDRGAAACYDLHARYTPGAGRIHFRIDSGRAIVAHIGEKLT